MYMALLFNNIEMIIWNIVPDKKTYFQKILVYRVFSSSIA